MKFSTRSGNKYKYEPFSNRIEHCETNDNSLFQENKIAFRTPEKIEKLENLSVFGLEITQNCNLRCSYCCYSGEYRNQRSHNPVHFTKEKICRFFEFIQENRNIQQPVRICFYGGEPLLQYELLRYIVSESLNRFGPETEFLITTNGMLLSLEMLLWMSKIPRFDINISFDGILQDINRKTSSGNSSYKVVYRNIEMLRNEFPDFYSHHCNFQVTIQNLRSLIEIAAHWDSDPLLKNKSPLNINSVAINYKMMNMNNNEGDTFSETLNELYLLWDYYKSHPDSAIMFSFFYKWLNNVKKRAIVNLGTLNEINCCLPHTLRCFIDADGDVAICEKMCDTYRIGNIYTGINYKTVNEYLDRFYRIRQKRCNSCWAVRLCDICLTCLDLNENELDYECKKQRDWTLLSLVFLCEVFEDKELKDRLFTRD